MSRSRFKILLAAEFPPFGGTRSFFFRLIRFYTEDLGLSVSVLIARNQLDDQVRALATTGSVKLVPHSAPTGLMKKLCVRFPFSLISEHLLLRNIVKKEAPDAIVVSVGTPGLYLWILRSRIPFLYFLHTIPVRRLSLFEVFRLSSLKEVGAIISVSKSAVIAIQRLWLTKKSSLPLDYVYNTAGPTLEKTITPSHRKTVLTLGHVDDYKNPVFWIEVAESIVRVQNDVTFLWGGDGPLLNFCRSIVTKKGLQDRIKFLGWTDDVDCLYGKSTVYFQPSLTESHGIAAIDAMRHGIPCVVSDVGGLRESIQHEICGYVFEVDNKLKATQQILALLIDDRLWLKMSQASMERYRMVFDEAHWDKTMRQLHQRQFGINGEQR